jgi:hypothetical protein
MKKALVVIGLASFLLGCSSTQAADKNEIRFEFTYSDPDVYIIKDKETGCKYVKSGGIAPLLTKEGKPDCGK